MLAKRYFDLRAEALGARPFSGVVWTFATNCRTRKAYSEADRSSAKAREKKANKRKRTKKKINKEKGLG